MSATDGYTLNRRQLIQAAGCALAALGLAGSSAAFASPGLAARADADDRGKARVGLIFCAGTSKEDAAEIKLVRSVVTVACPRIEFTTRTVYDADQARSIAREANGLDGYLVWSVGRHAEAVNAFTKCDRPVVIAYDGIAGR